MADPAPSSDKGPGDIQSRLSSIEAALQLDERLKTIEEKLSSRTQTKSQPWWRNAKTITILGAFLAAILPAVTAIDGVLKNQRESQRLLLEQQDKIRQTYLDRVLKPGVTEGEQQRIFGLLVKLKSDPEFQEWAADEYNKTTKKLDDLIKEKRTLEEENRKLSEQIKLEKGSLSAGTQSAQSKLKIQKLESEALQKEREVANLRQRIGEQKTPSDIFYKVIFSSIAPGEKFYLWRHNPTYSERLGTYSTPITLSLHAGYYRIENATHPSYEYARELIIVADTVIEVPSAPSSDGGKLSQ